MDENGNPVDAATDAVPPATETVDKTADSGVGIAGRTLEGGAGGDAKSGDGAGSSGSSSGSGSGGDSSTDGGGRGGTDGHGNFCILGRDSDYIVQKPKNLFLKTGAI